jgi:signal peptidase I
MKLNEPLVDQTVALHTVVELPRNETFVESIASICTVLVVGLFAMAFVFQNFEIPSGSMHRKPR